MRSRSVATFAAALFALTSTSGCIKKTLIKGQIDGIAEASPAIDTFSDVEVARGAAFAGISQLEGLHKLLPSSDKGLYLLAKGWAGAAFAFIEDDAESADDKGDGASADYHRARARAAYDRALAYGVELLERDHKGFETARRDSDSMHAWLKQFDDADDAAELLWVGQAWVSRVNVASDDPDLVAELFVGVAMIEQSVALDETLFYGLGHTILGAYHARTAMGELDESLQHFQRALAINGGKALLTKFQMARSYYCQKSDQASYEKTLREILAAGDTLPEQRLQNSLAKRRARRYLGITRERNCGF